MEIGGWTYDEFPDYLEREQLPKGAHVTTPPVTRSGLPIATTFPISSETESHCTCENTTAPERRARARHLESLAWMHQMRALQVLLTCNQSALLKIITNRVSFFRKLWIIEAVKAHSPERDLQRTGHASFAS